MRRLATRIALLASLPLLSACGNPFAPEKHKPDDEVVRQPAPPATTPEQLMDNLARAMRDRDIDLYETLIDEDFWFTETDCTGDIVFANGREEELELMGGSRDGSRPGIFDIFRTFEYEFTPIRRYTELGPEFPEAFEGDPDGHPDEDWEVFRGRVFMLLLEAADEGFRVEQEMSFKLHQKDDGLWTIIRWVNDPLAGGCGDIDVETDSAEKASTARPTSWAALKHRPR